MRGNLSLKQVFGFSVSTLSNFPHNSTPHSKHPFLSYTPAHLGLPVGKEKSMKHTLGEYKEAILNAASARSRERFFAAGRTGRVRRMGAGQAGKAGLPGSGGIGKEAEQCQ